MPNLSQPFHAHDQLLNMGVSRLAAAIAASLAAFEADDGIDTVADDTTATHRDLRLSSHAHLAGARLLRDDTLGGGIA